MTDSQEFEINPDSFSAELFFDVEQITDYVATRNERGADRSATLRKVGTHIDAITRKYNGAFVFLEAPLMLYPINDEIGAGTGELSGRIIGFSWQSYPTINDSLEQGEPHEGVTMLVTVGVQNGLPSKGHEAWQNFFPAAILEAVGDDVHLLAVPVTEGLTVQKLSTPPADFATVEDFLNLAKEQVKEPYNYKSYVNRIEALLHGLAIFNENEIVDKARINAAMQELQAMVDNCPFLGSRVAIVGDYLRTPHPEKPGGILIYKGRVEGILRKFVYQPYLVDGQLRGAVQAVIYPPEVATKVVTGELMPDEADNMPGTIFAPLNIEHKLEIVE